MEEMMIVAKDITKTFALGKLSVPVLHSVNLAVSPGEFVSMMGPSGSGKSTLLYILGGLDKPDAGEVWIGNRPIAPMNDCEESLLRRDEIGFIFQSYNLIENLTVEENIMFPAKLKNGRSRQWKARKKEHLEMLLEAVGLEDRRNHRPAELSGGQQQRTAIARALINSPSVLFADEPTGNLDSTSGNEILGLLHKVNVELGTTILMVTHSQEATHYTHRMIRLKDGIIL